MEYGEFNGTLLGGPILDEGKFLMQWMEILMRGASKPNSPLFEIQKISREIEKAKNAGKDTKDLEALKQNQINCCPSSTTVNDALEFKRQIKAINRRIIEITGIETYYE